jgi:mannose-1-phosphate guanylyltransferase / phosphomannomutase
MKAIILSGGKGTRMKKINNKIPKVLLKIGGKSMIEWNIEFLKRYGVNNLLITTHYRSNMIKKSIGNGDNWKMNINYYIEEKPLGTSGALYNLKDYFNETFLVLYGDVISNINLNELIKFHKRKKASVTLVIHKTDHPEDSDIVQIKKNKQVNKLIHKPGNNNFGNLGNAAMYVLEPKVFKYLPKGKSDFIKDIFPKMIENKEKVFGYETNEFIKDLGTPRRFIEVQQYLNNIKNY